MSNYSILVERTKTQIHIRFIEIIDEIGYAFDVYLKCTVVKDSFSDIERFIVLIDDLLIEFSDPSKNYSKWQEPDEILKFIDFQGRGLEPFEISLLKFITIHYVACNKDLSFYACLQIVLAEIERDKSKYPVIIEYPASSEWKIKLPTMGK